MKPPASCRIVKNPKFTGALQWAAVKGASSWGPSRVRAHHRPVTPASGFGTTGLDDWRAFLFRRPADSAQLHATGPPNGPVRPVGPARSDTSTTAVRPVRLRSH